ncbi:MAG: glycosyl transferase family 1 [Frankiales bacterium]|nr:glycosyl transferase family 1 [Frankiales bacterium]
MPLTVLHVSETTLGGVGVVLRDLVAAQVARGDRVVVAAPQDDQLARAVAPTGGRAYTWVPGARPGPAMPHVLRQLRQVVRTERPDLVHLHTSMAGMCGRLVVRRRVPTVFQPHSWSFFAVEGAARTGALVWERLGARWADVVLCVSADERTAAAAHGIRARMEVVPNGVDLARWQSAGPQQRQAARTRLGLADGPLAVCVGRLHRQKGQHRLLDVWPDVLAEVPAASLALVGGGPDEESLRGRRVPAVLMPGSGNVADWLAAADVVAQPSRWEGMSLSLLEAMASARSVVVTDVPGMAEVVRDGSGQLVTEGDGAELAAALVRRLTDPVLAAAEGARGRELVAQHHDLAVQRAAVLRVVDQAAAR